MNTLELLREGKVRITQGWCQQAYARTKDDHNREPGSPQAVKWCAAGALGFHRYAQDEGSRNAWGEAMDMLADSIGPRADIFDSAVFASPVGENRVLSWNDLEGTTQDEVLETYDRAIEAQRSRA